MFLSLMSRRAFAEMFQWKHVSKYHSLSVVKFRKNIVRIYLLRNVNKVQRKFVGMFQVLTPSNLGQDYD